jgi:hypothetical protein
MHLCYKKKVFQCGHLMKIANPSDSRYSILFLENSRLFLLVEAFIIHRLDL